MSATSTNVFLDEQEHVRHVASVVEFLLFYPWRVGAARLLEALGYGVRGDWRCIPHDLRRSGVKHCIESGVSPHIVMQWSGHRTMSMLSGTGALLLEFVRSRRQQHV